MGGGLNNSDFSLLGRKIGAAHGAVISYNIRKYNRGTGKRFGQSNISFAEKRLQFKSYQKAVNMPPKRQNTKNRLSDAKLNTFLQL